MKICMICASFPEMKCGVADYTAQLVNCLKTLGQELTVITSSHGKIKQRLKTFENEGIRVLPLIKHWGFVDGFILFRKLIGLKPDIVHIQYQWWMYHKKAMITLLPMFLKFLKKNYFIVTTFHDLMGPYLFPKAGSIRKLGIKTLAIFSDRIITTNKKDTEDLYHLIPDSSGKISRIPTGPGISLDNPGLIDTINIRRRLKDDDRQILVSNFGYMLPYKGLEDLLQAAKILIDKKYKIKLLAIGGFDIELKVSNSYFSQLQKKAEILKISPYIEWLGHCSVPEVSSYLLASDICVLPYTDGVSERRTSFISVLAHGLPIITTRYNNTPEKLIDHENVLLVSPNNPNQLVVAIEELINSPQLREKLAKQARKLFEEEYCWDIIANNTLKVYDN